MGTALLEPVGRNTAPALTLAALAAVQNGQDPVLVVTPADQTIANSAAFTVAVQQAIAQAEQGNIVILGVTPDKPETGYGYIHTETSGSLPLQANVYKVQAFIEKPKLQTAKQYLSEGSYYWNAGMFVLKASVWSLMQISGNHMLWHFPKSYSHHGFPICCCKDCLVEDSRRSTDTMISAKVAVVDCFSEVGKC